ncbi:ATP-binding protein [Caballeronia sp. LZ062]|uniref:sensor histidine kinase n=1 Tax=unclassified Caballeronia TaxID=2646786 RepID=UPI0028614141|nr:MULTISPECIES: ATP-binding protein [unclassified Caballeronia]MDR5855949.1 ATP-binding protein [Caballeronia sp. LZ050]MDR5872265.1 ATP-binding protein [Caballeronia sp. LZ062]
MNPSAVIALDERAPSRASLRGVSSPTPDAPGSPFSALIDAKLRGDRENQRLRARLRDLAAQAGAADERARRHLAGDLHDEAGAILTAANIAIARAEFLLPADAPAACAEALRHARECLAEVAATNHRIVEGLHAPSLEDGLAAALAEWLASFGARAGLVVNLSCSVEIYARRLPQNLAVALFRIAQESLGNVARHAHATRANVTLTADDEAVTLVVEDDGIGITPAARRKSGRLGLASMRTRCEAFGGALRVAASSTGGTCVRARLPLTATPRAALRAVND